MPYQIAPMTRAEMDVAVDWAAQEGWNPGLADAERFFASDPQGFLAGRLDGEPIAFLSAVRYGATLGFCGFYIVRPDRRGHGHGLALTHAGLARLEGRTVGCDGVVAQQENYKKLGFRLAHGNVRYQGVVPPAPVPPGRGRIVDCAALPFAALADYDAGCFSLPRPAFLRGWIQPPHRALALVEDGRVLGYGADAQSCASSGSFGQR